MFLSKDFILFIILLKDHRSRELITIYLLLLNFSKEDITEHYLYFCCFLFNFLYKFHKSKFFVFLLTANTQRRLCGV